MKENLRLSMTQIVRDISSSSKSSTPTHSVSDLSVGLFLAMRKIEENEKEPELRSFITPQGCQVYSRVAGNSERIVMEGRSDG